jgi:hypothetical protein
LVLPNKERFDRFGKLRNGIQHFGPPPGRDASDETLRFVFEVIDPFVNSCWGLFAVYYDEDHEPYVYFVNALVSREIMFLISPGAAATFDEWEVDWTEVTLEYKEQIEARVRAALQ